MRRITYPGNWRYLIGLRIWVRIALTHTNLTWYERLTKVQRLVCFYNVPLSFQLHRSHTTGRHGGHRRVALLCLLSVLLKLTFALSQNIRRYIYQVASGIAVCVLELTVSQRPDIFYNGRIVDRQYTTRFLGWITISWIQPILDKCRQFQHICIDELPDLDRASRGECLYARWSPLLRRHNSLTARNLQVGAVRELLRKGACFAGMVEKDPNLEASYFRGLGHG